MESLQTTVVAHLNFSKLVFELLHLTKIHNEPLHYPCLHLKQSIPNTLLRIFSAACNLDSEESSKTCHNLPVLLLLSRR